MEMKDLKVIIEGHTASELAEIMFKDLSNYHITKLGKAMEKAIIKIDTFNYEEKKEPVIATSPFNIALGVSVGEDEIKRLARQINEASVRDTRRREMQSLIEKELKDWRNIGSTVDFVISRFDGTVKAIVKDRETNEIDSVGKAICNKQDTFDTTTGKLLAIYKASYKDTWKEKLENAGFGDLFI